MISCKMCLSPRELTLEYEDETEDRIRRANYISNIHVVCLSSTDADLWFPCSLVCRLLDLLVAMVRYILVPHDRKGRTLQVDTSPEARWQNTAAGCIPVSNDRDIQGSDRDSIQQTDRFVVRTVGVNCLRERFL